MTADSAYGYNDGAVLPVPVGFAAGAQGCQYASSRVPPPSSPMPWPPHRSCRLFSRLSTRCCESAATTLCWPCLRASGTGLCEWGRRVWSGLRDGPSRGRKFEAPCHLAVHSLRSSEVRFRCPAGVVEVGFWVPVTLSALSWGFPCPSSRSSVLYNLALLT